MIPSTDKRVQFIGGLAAYEQDGGSVKRDLFDARKAGYALDGALVEKLAACRLALKRVLPQFLWLTEC